MKLKDILQGKVYTDKDRPPFQVKEALTKKAYPELKGQNKYLLNSVKNLMRAIKNQNDLTTREEIEYIHTKSKLMMSMLDDKRYNESVDEQQKKQASSIQKKYDKAHLKFAREVRDIIGMINRYQGDKTDGKIIDKAYSKHLIPFNQVIQSWTDGQYRNPNLSEDFWANPAPFSSQEAKLHLDMDIKKMSKHLGKASQQVIKIMMDGVKGGRYDALDIQRGFEHGPAGRMHDGEKTFMKLLWRKVRDGFRRYSKNNKLRK